MKMTCPTRFIGSVYYIVLMNLCIVVKTILMSVPLSPNAPARSTSPMNRHFIIVDIDVVLPLPNSRMRETRLLG